MRLYVAVGVAAFVATVALMLRQWTCGTVPDSAMPYSRLMRVVLAPLRWWIMHPWAVLWLMILPAMVVMANPELPFRRSRFLHAFIVFATVIQSVSLALGLRVSWHRSRTRALLLAVGLALVLLLWSSGENGSLSAAMRVVVPLALIIGGAAGLEYAGRAQPLRELLEVPTALRLRGWQRAALVAVIILALIVGLVVDFNWKIHVARSRAETLCAAAVVGGPVAGLQATGEDLGLAMWSLSARTEPDGKVHAATIMGWSGWMFARWVCTIEHEDGKVLGKQTYFHD